MRFVSKKLNPYCSSAELAWGQRRRSPEGQVCVLAGNVLGEPAKQFDYWIDPGDLVGANAVYVLDKPDERTDWISSASKCFTRFEPVETIILEAGGRELRRVRIFVGHDYRGPPAPTVVQEGPGANVARRGQSKP